MDGQITVHGQGEVKAMPDLAVLTLTTTAQAADQAEGVRQNAEQATALIVILQEIGIADKDIETQNYSARPQYNYQKKPPAMTGYQVQNNLQVTVRELNQVGSIVGKAAGCGATIGSISFGLSDRAQAKAEALTQAVVSARGKAAVMAAAAGIELGRLLNMTKGASDAFLPDAYAGGALSSAPESAKTPISAQQVEINAFVTLVYALEPAA